MTRRRAGLLVALLLSGPAQADGAVMSHAIEQVKARHEQALLALPGVVSVGIGRDARGRPEIVVGLDGARPETRARLPARLEDYPVRVEVIGPVRAR